MSELSQAIDEMRNMRESYDALAGAASAYSTGKAELATNITNKGVPASVSETLPELAEKVNAIAQESYTIDGGEMYAKQLYGSLTTPNYWNLYEVLAQLLSDGRLVNYGGILLAEYHKGYDSLALSGAGAGGAYVVSDKDSDGNFIMYTSDTTHTWDTAFDGKGNRWVAYCFADEWHDFQITDTNTSPRSIFIGRKVGTITSLVSGHCHKIVVPDGNKLQDFKQDGLTMQEWDKNIVIRNLGMHDASRNLLYAVIPDSVYIQLEGMGGTVTKEKGLFVLYAQQTFTGSIIIELTGETSEGNMAIYTSSGSMSPAVMVVKGGRKFNGCICTAKDNTNAIYTVEDIEDLGACVGNGSFITCLGKLYLNSIEETSVIGWGYFFNSCNFSYIYIGYKTNDRSKSLAFSSNAKMSNLTDIELKPGYKKNCNISALTDNLTVENIALHLLDRLADNTGEETLTLTIGASNLATILADETYASYVTAAQAKNWTIA